jgi:LmbE family N-acetylglucosaminyl deacetylase
MTHVFISPHPDDVALSCGGLITSLRELGQNVTIITVYSGGARTQVGSLTEYQRAALGFGSKALWPVGEAFRRTNIPADVPVPVLVGETVLGERPPWEADPERIALTQDRANTQARQFWQRASWTRSANITNEETDARPIADSIGGQGSFEVIDYEDADAAEIRRVEDERYAWFMEASVIQLDLPDAVYRGYTSDDELLGGPRQDDEAPYDLLRQEILRLEPQMIYFPLGVGNHVDHVLCRDVAVSMLAEPRRWVMPGPELVGSTTFYEDFPYAWWRDFTTPSDLDTPLDLPRGLDLEARYAEIGESMERKAAGIRLYSSQITRLFNSDQGMLDDLAGYHARVAVAGGVPSTAAERYWAVVSA